jgi:hypothetical protein
MIAGLAVSGVLTIAFAAGLSSAVRGSRIGSTFVALSGLGLIAIAFLRNDCSSVTQACEARVDAGAVSWHHRAHDILSAPLFAAAVLAPLLMAFSFRTASSLRPLALYSLATATALAVLFTLGGLEVFPAWEGMMQRAAVSTAALWVEIVALVLLRLA